MADPALVVPGERAQRRQNTRITIVATAAFLVGFLAFQGTSGLSDAKWAAQRLPAVSPARAAGVRFGALPNPEELGLTDEDVRKSAKVQPLPKPLLGTEPPPPPPKKVKERKFQPRFTTDTPPQVVDPTGMAQWRAGKLLPEGWDALTPKQKAWNLWAGKYGALFWMNAVGAWGSMLILFGWVVFRFVGPSLGLYQLEDGGAPDLAPLVDFTPAPPGYSLVPIDGAPATADAPPPGLAAPAE